MKRRLLIGAGLAVFAWASLTAHDWWVARQAVANERIAQLQRDIAAANARVRVRDRVLDSLRRADSAHKAQVRAQEAQAQVSAQGWAAAKTELRALAALNGGLVPLASVEAGVAKADVALLDCQQLNAGLKARNGNLEAQVAQHAANRVDLDSISTKKDSVLTETVKSLRPPWWVRSFSWVQDHAATLAIGAAGGFVLAKQ